MEQLAQILAPLIGAYVGDLGIAVQIVSIVGTFRLFFKPIVAGIESAINESESKEDDIILGKVKQNAIYKGFIFVIDLVASIKIPKKK